MQTKPINLIVADDHKLFRKGIILMLHSDKDVQEIWEASNGIEVIKLLETKRPDVILMDIRMPIKDGIETSEYVLKKYPDIKILILSMHNEDEYIYRLMEIGVHGYLLKDTDPSEVIEAIKAVIENDFYYNQYVFDVLRKKAISDYKSVLIADQEVQLDQKEKDILEMICEEHTNKIIGDKLKISQRTVENIRGNLMRKLRVHNTVGLVKFAIQKKIYNL